MHLYIANATKQQQNFTYKPLEKAVHRTQIIPIGQQIKISGDLSTPDIEYIVAQHRPYGLISVDEVDRTRVFSGLCYSIDKPVPGKIISLLMGTNEQRLLEQGAEMRKQAAIAASRQLEDSIQETQLPERLTTFEASVVEENHDPSTGLKPVAEGVRVVTDEVAATQQPASGRRGRRR